MPQVIEVDKNFFSLECTVVITPKVATSKPSIWEVLQKRERTYRTTYHKTKVNLLKIKGNIDSHIDTTVELIEDCMDIFIQQNKDLCDPKVVNIHDLSFDILVTGVFHDRHGHEFSYGEPIYFELSAMLSSWLSDNKVEYIVRTGEMRDIADFFVSEIQKL